MIGRRWPGWLVWLQVAGSKFQVPGSQPGTRNLEPATSPSVAAPPPTPSVSLPPPRDVRRLRLYRDAFDAAGRVFALSASFPAHERLRLTDQVRKSSRSVCANLAEGWGKRRYPAAFAGKLSDAGSEAAETAFWLATAGRCGYLDVATAAALARRYSRLAAQLDQVAADAAFWCGAAGSSPGDEGGGRCSS